MIDFSDTALSAFLAGFLWPLARIGALVAAAPVLGNLGVPRRIKVLLAVAITVTVAPLAGPPADVQLWSGAGVLVLAQELLIGAAMGLVIRLAFAIVDVAGEITGLQMGLGFAIFFDPQHGTHTQVIAQFLGLLATLTFLSLNGHLLMISALAESFRALPVGGLGPAGPAWLMLANLGGSIFASGLMLALPVIAALLITNVALGVLTRASPQLNFFAVGFPVTILVGWAVLTLMLPLMPPILGQVFDGGLRMMFDLPSFTARR